MSYLRGDGGATERELEALALYMGHSVAMQRDSYDRRTKDQKVMGFLQTDWSCRPQGPLLQQRACVWCYVAFGIEGPHRLRRWHRLWSCWKS